MGISLHFFQYIVFGRPRSRQVPSFRNPTKCVGKKIVDSENYSEFPTLHVAKTLKTEVIVIIIIIIIIAIFEPGALCSDVGHIHT